MEVQGIIMLPRTEFLDRIAEQRDWYDKLQERFGHPSAPATHLNPEATAATYTPASYAVPASYLLYTQSGSLALMLAQNGSASTTEKPFEKNPDSIKAVDSSVGANIDQRF